MYKQSTLRKSAKLDGRETEPFRKRTNLRCGDIIVARLPLPGGERLRDIWMLFETDCQENDVRLRAQRCTRQGRDYCSVLRAREQRASI